MHIKLNRILALTLALAIALALFAACRKPDVETSSKPSTDIIADTGDAESPANIYAEKRYAIDLAASR